MGEAFLANPHFFQNVAAKGVTGRIKDHGACRPKKISEENVGSPYQPNDEQDSEIEKIVEKTSQRPPSAKFCFYGNKNKNDKKSNQNCHPVGCQKR